MNQTLDLINVDEFKALPNEQKKAYLREIRQVFSDKDIRDYWDMKYAAFHYYLSTLELNKQEKDDSNNKKDESKIKKNSTKTNNANKRHVIDAEFRVMKDDKEDVTEDVTMVVTQINPAFLEAQEQVKQSVDINTPMMNFPDTNGTVAQLRKKLEGILMILESEGEDSIYRMKIQVFKN